MKKPVSRWIKVIMVLSVAGLFYAVYFTELGKPPPQNEPPMTFYNQTAVPTIFAQWSPVPIVELDWAYASQNLLKFAIKIQNLETNMDPADWVCNPYIKTGQPVTLRLRGYQTTPMYDVSGEVIQLIYEYEMHAATYDFLAIEMDITIGPCADHWNPQELSATALELIGNYHLSFQVPVKISTLVPSKNAPAVAVWNGIPTYPGANQLREENEFYVYTVLDTSEEVEAFYDAKMSSDGWEQFQRAKMTINDRQGTDFYYSKLGRIIMISILVSTEDKPTTVSLSLVQ